MAKRIAHIKKHPFGMNNYMILRQSSKMNYNKWNIEKLGLLCKERIPFSF
jgi:hypothetical protein